jgi:hypothetical protein
MRESSTHSIEDADPIPDAVFDGKPVFVETNSLTWEEWRDILTFLAKAGEDADEENQ